MTLTLIHNADTQAIGCGLLAKEINVNLDGTEQDIPLIPLFVCELLDQIVAAADDGGIPRPHPICSIAVTFAWAFRRNVRNGCALIAQARAFIETIRSIDDDDGWPADRWLNALVGCCIAMELGLEDPAHIRWPAEAAGEVYALVAGFHKEGVHDLDKRNAWICQRFSAARRAARKLTQ